MPRVYVTTDPSVRFWRHVNKDGPIPPLHPELSNCWIWVGSLDPQGYGHFWAGERTANGNPYPTYAHRFAFGEDNIPKGMEINHLCEVETCCLPDHLVLSTRRENARYGNSMTALRAAQTHCLRGHLLDSANTYIRKNGTRQCLTCPGIRKTLRLTGG